MPQWYNDSFSSLLQDRRQQRLEQMRKRMIDNALREEKEAKAFRLKSKKIELENG